MSQIRKIGCTGELRNTAAPEHVKRTNAAGTSGFDLEARVPLAERVGPTVGELARPLDRLPDRPNDAVLKAAGISGR